MREINAQLEEKFHVQRNLTLRDGVQTKTKKINGIFQIGSDPPLNGKKTKTKKGLKTL